MTLQQIKTYSVGAAIVGVLEGDIDIANVATASAQLMRAVSPDAIGLVLDLSAVRYLDSAGVRMLFELTRKLAMSRQGLAIALPEGAPLRRLLKITNVSEAAPIVSSVDQAADTLGRDSGAY